MKRGTVALTRVFDAPRARVFAAWTRAEHLAGWFGPRRFTVPVCEADARPGGAIRVCFRSPEGRDFWVRGVYREVLPPERLVIACTAGDDQGAARLEEVIDVRFAEHGGKTTLTLQVTASGVSDEAAVMLEGMEETWARTVKRLDSHLKPDS